MSNTITEVNVGTFNFSQSEWDAAKREARGLLIERAKLRGMIPYSDLADQIRTMNFEAHDQRLFHLLGEISSEESAAGRGMLSVIVVHKAGDMQPGPGFFELANRLGRDTSEILRCWVNELKKVHAVWSGA
jgi:molybdopterin synthase catalytic subunit